MRRAATAIALLLALPCVAQAADDGAASRQALRADAWASSDADGNETRKLALGWDFSHRDADHWWGAKVEHARFSGDGWAKSEQRVYLDGAGSLGGWLWDGKLGGNGHTVLGAFSVHSQDPWRKELFVERETLETREGVRRGLAQTFAGAALDMPFSERWSATALAGLQDFGAGSNLRTHLRGNLVYAVAPEQGLSLQLRTRYYHDSEPYEGDYYSPPWYGEALGVLAWRRHVGGYAWSARAGWGRQRSADEGWKRARMLGVGLETPRWKDAWLRVDAGYTDTPVLTATGGNGSYAYRYLQVQAVVAF
jgi:hypothetical protein